MNELLTALQAAAKAGFDAPKCNMCNGAASVAVRSCWMCEDYGRDHAHDCEPPPSSKPCARCHATGLDASDPERLIGRAAGWLLKRKHYPAIHTYLVNVCFVNYTEVGDMLELDQAHDGTPAGLATALLRFVVWVGGAA